MSDVIIFIRNQKIKPGKLEELKRHYQRVVVETEATKPGKAAHLAYTSEDGSLLSIVHIFPDADAFDRHMVGVAEYARQAFEFVEIASFEIFGQPSQAVMERSMQIAGSGVTVTIKPNSIGGYIRLKAG